MPEFISDLFWDTLQFNPWVRRVFFVVLIAVPPLIGWFSWTGMALAIVVWALYEIGDGIGLGKSRKK